MVPTCTLPIYARCCIHKTMYRYGVKKINKFFLSFLCRQHRRCTATAAADGGSTAAPLQDRPPQKRPGRKRREIWTAASSGGGPCLRPGPPLGKRPPAPSTHRWHHSSNNNDDKFAGGELCVTWLHADGALPAGDGGPPGRALRGTPPDRGGQENPQGTYATVL